MNDNITDNETMIQIDFSKKYTTKYSTQIQSSHFVKNQLIIHTGVYYSRNEDHQLQTTSIATFSEHLDHQAQKLKLKDKNRKDL